MVAFEPAYLALLRSGELLERAQTLEAMLSACDICPHDCRVDRLAGQIARCYSAYLPIVSSYCAHFGEEPGLVGERGVGNIFFGNCNLRCVYCQNHEISQRWKEERRSEVSCERLAEMMLELQERGCHAIGLVSPTHFVPQIIRSLALAAEAGLRLPLIYNTNTYDALPVLRLLEGIVDIYLPDMKYADDAAGWAYSKVPRYVEHSRAAIVEMHRQVGSALVWEDGLVRRGLIIRHLVLPNDLADSEATLRWIRDALGSDVTLSIMSQYYPTHKATDILLLSRGIREGEYHRVLALLDRFGFTNGWVQDFASQNFYRPDFSDRIQPFRT